MIYHRAEPHYDRYIEEFNGTTSDGHANPVHILNYRGSFKQFSRRSSVYFPDQKQVFKKIFKKIGKKIIPDLDLEFDDKVRYDDGEYFGQFHDQKRHGLGIMKFYKKFKYFGEWRNDKIQGFGLLYMGKKGKYLGEFKNNAFNGQGEFTVGSDYYIGHWKNNLKHGFGKERCEDSYYEGGFFKGQKQGQGIFKNKDFRVEGTFKDNQLVCGSSEIKEFKCKYEGEWKEQKSHGRGKIFFSKKSDSKVRSLIGVFQNGELKCGKARLSDSSKYVSVSSPRNHN